MSHTAIGSLNSGEEQRMKVERTLGRSSRTQGHTRAEMGPSLKQSYLGVHRVHRVSSDGVTDLLRVIDSNREQRLQPGFLFAWRCLRLLT